MIDSLSLFFAGKTYVVLVMCALLAALIFSGRKPAIIFVIALMAFYLPGTLTTAAMLSGFINPALVVLILLIIFASILEKTQYVHALTSFIARGAPRLALLRLVFFTGITSAIANNTAVVATLMGSLQVNKSVIPSKVLIPLSYASILGGMLTLVGTSTNLIVSAFMVSKGLPELELFDFTPLGVCVFVVCGGLIVLSAGSLLPNNNATISEPQARYFLEATVQPGSPLIDATVSANGLRSLHDLFLVEIIRPWARISPVSPGIVIREADVLVFSGRIDRIDLINQFEGLSIQGENHHSLLSDNLYQSVVAHNSRLAGRTISEIDFRANFDAAVVAVCRGHSEIRGGLGRLRLRTGDLLLLAVGEDFDKLTGRSNALLTVNKAQTEKSLTAKQSLFAVAIFIVALAASFVGIVSLLKAMCAVLAICLIAKLITLGEVRRRVPLDLILIVGSAIGIAHVVVESGLAQALADFIIGVFTPFGIYGALIGIYLMTLLLTELITNNASAALACPIAYSLAITLDAPILPFFMAVAFAASASFMSPYGYQTNLMVLAAGRYRFADYVKIGSPVSMAYSATVLLLMPIFFPLSA